jgi:transcriptional regulator with XRE-family HTH domain
MASRSRKNPYLVALGQAVRDQREKLGMSQEDLGFECKVHRTYVGGIERGERNPTVLTLIKMTAVLKTTPARLLRDAELAAG